MIWYILASFFPCILVVLFSVLTRSKWVGTILTLILIGNKIEKVKYTYRLIMNPTAIKMPKGLAVEAQEKWIRKLYHKKSRAPDSQNQIEQDR